MADSEQVNNSDATSQLFINFPIMIANALGIEGMCHKRVIWAALT